METVKIEYAFAAADLVKAAVINKTSFIKALKLKVPNLTNPVTAHVACLDKDGDAIYTSAEKAENDTHVLTGLDIPADYDFQLQVTLSGAPGAGGGNVEVTAYIKP